MSDFTTSFNAFAAGATLFASFVPGPRLWRILLLILAFVNFLFWLAGLGVLS